MRPQTALLPSQPGPKPKPLIENLFDIPLVKPWMVYTRWGKQYESGLLSASACGQRIVVINTLKDAVELLDKRSHIYSDRPTVAMIDLMGWDFHSSMLRYTDRWRRHRRIFQQTFRKDVSIRYQPTQTRKVHDLLQSLLDSPDEFSLHHRTLAAAIIMGTMYGHDVAPKNDRFVAIAEDAVTKASEALLPGASAVNTFPILRYWPSWLPGAGFKRHAKETNQLTREMLNRPFDFVRENMAAGTGQPSLLADLLEINDSAAHSSKVDEEIIKETVSSLGTFFYAMALNPEVQRKAQAELDTIIGGRLPTYDDRESMPYIEALYREVLRWRPVLPLGIPHSTIQDDIYNGYFIPKGRLRAMAHDESVYKNPELFQPERFLTSDGGLTADESLIAYGFGRRICVGRHMASSTVWLVIASVISVFNIDKAKDASGNTIDITSEYTDGAISHPQAFQCSITPRSGGARKIIEDAKDSEA
ncbi:cytochrome P450 [Infundibulicybe gibba]|nr:cytochrome P450 [Infundibulicybe gibba]